MIATLLFNREDKIHDLQLTLCFSKKAVAKRRGYHPSDTCRLGRNFRWSTDCEDVVLNVQVKGKKPRCFKCNRKGHIRAVMRLDRRDVIQTAEG